MIDSQDKETSAFLDKALAKAKNTDAAKNALAMLFPKIERVAETYAGTQSSDAERYRNRRLSVSDFAANYFNLTPQSGLWGQTEFQEIIKVGPREAFDALKSRLTSTQDADQSELRRVFIDLLDAEFSAGKDLTEDWLQEILKQSETLIVAKDETTKFLFSIDNEDRLVWLIKSGLERLSKNQVAHNLRMAIQSANDLTLLCNLVRETVGDEHPDGAKSEGSRVNLGDEASSVRDTLVDRVRSLAESGQIWKQANPAKLIWFWWGANLESEVKNFTQDAMASPTALRSLLSISINRVRSSNKDYDRVSPTWNKIVDLDALSERARHLKKTGNDADRTLAERFLEALQNGKERHF